MKAKTSFILLVLMILIWGLVWPVNKIGLTYTSAWNYIEWRLIFGALTSFLIALCTRNLVWPRKKDALIILTVGFLQMGLMMTLSNYGLSLIGAGKATFLCFTTSIWIIPLSVFVHRKLPRTEIFSLMIGLLGIVLLIEPWAWKEASSPTIIGFLALIGSAISWAAGILCARYLPWHRPPIQLLPWQILVATLFTILVAYWNGVGLRPDTTTPLFFASFLFTGSISIAIGYWLMILISKHLPPSVTSLGLLFVPILSMAISLLFLGEEMSLNLAIALSFITLGILLHIYSERKRKKLSSSEIKPS